MFLKKKIILLFILAMPFIPVAAGQSGMFSDTVVLQKNDKTIDLVILVNGNSKIVMKNVPTEGYLEIYSVIGVRISRINLKQCIGVGEYPIELPKGVCIFRAGKVAQKVFVK